MTNLLEFQLADLARARSIMIASWGSEADWRNIYLKVYKLAAALEVRLAMHHSPPYVVDLDAFPRHGEGSTSYAMFSWVENAVGERARVST